MTNAWLGGLVFHNNIVKKGLLSTTALISAAVTLCGAGVARAGTVSTARAVVYNMVASEALTITSSGSITTGAKAIGVSFITVDSITNEGTVATTCTSSCASAIDLSNSVLNGGINNTGIITGGEEAFDINNTTVATEVYNSGTITGDRIFDVRGTSSITADITNDTGGALSADATAIRLLGGGGATISGNITNKGVIKAPNTTSATIVALGATISGNIINEGTITGANAAIGSLSGADITGLITNKGTISSASNAAIGIAIGSDMSGGIVNEGSMTGNLTFAISAASDMTGDITNKSDGSIFGNTLAFITTNAGSDISGTVTNEGSINAGFASFFVDDAADMSGGIVNSGTLGANGATASNATIVVKAASLTGGVVNTGTIDGSNTGKGAIFLKGAVGNVPININGGRVIGDVIDDTPGNGFSIVTIGGDFTTEGDFDVSSFDVNASKTLTFGNGNTITSVAALGNSGTIKVLAGEAGTVTNTLTSTGEVSVAAGGTLSADTFGGAGTFTIGVSDDGDNTLDAGDFGILTATGSAINLGDDTLNFDVSGGVAAGAGIIIASGTAPATTALTVTDNSALYDISLIADGNDLKATVAKVGAGAPDVATKGNNTSIATVVQNIIDTVPAPDAQLQSVLNKVTGAADAAAVNAVMNTLKKGLVKEHAIGPNTVSDKTITIAMQRLNSIRGVDTLASLDTESGMAAGNKYAKTSERHAWGQVFGQMAEQDERQGFEGYSSRTYGVVFGVDTKDLYDNYTIGMAASYGNTSVDSDNANNIQTDINTYQFSVYGDYALDEVTRIDGIVGFSWSDIEMDVFDIGGVPGLDAKGDFAGRHFSFEGGLSRDYKTKKGLIVTPGALVNYVYYDADNYQETGAGGASQIVDNSEIQLFELGGEVEVSGKYKIPSSNAQWLRTNVVAGVRHDFIGDKMEVTSQFSGGGAAFKTYGAEPAQTTYNIGAGFKRYGGDDWEVTGKYDLDFKEDYYSHSASLRFGHRF